METFLTDKPRVNIFDSGSVENWASQLGCSTDELLFCVAKVGSSIVEIKKYLLINDQLMIDWMK